MSTELAPKSSRAVVVHRVRAREPWVVATLIVLLLPVLAVSAAAAYEPSIVLGILFGFTGMPFAVVFCAVYLLWRRASRFDADKVPRAARATRQGLEVDGGPFIPRASIVAAHVAQSWPNGAYVRVQRTALWPVEFWTADVEGAHALVAGLGLDATRVVGIASGAALIEGLVARLAVGIAAITAAALAVSHASALGMIIPLIAIMFGALTLAPRKFVVGTDGVLIKWLGRRVGFIPLRDIAAVEQLPGVVRLHLRNGRVRDLCIARRIGEQAQEIGLRVGVLGERVRAAMRRAGSLEIDTSALERENREVGSYIASLRDLARGTGYRAAVQREDLIYLVEDGDRPPRVRVAAAVALGAADEHERARLRIAAESSSLPELREALDAVLSGDEQRLRASLEQVD